MLFFLAIAALLGPPSGSLQADAPLELAREALRADDPARAIELLDEWLAHEAGGGEIRALLGEALAELERVDEAAHNLALALEQGDLDERRAKSVKRLLRKLDGLARDRDRLVDDVVEALFEVAEDLEQGGHSERALALAERVRPFAQDARTAAGLDELIELVRSREEEVRLEGEAAPDEDSDVLPLVEHESEFYRFECNLEPDVVERLGRTMDQVFGFYVQVYLDGEPGRADSRKATIRVYPDSETMLTEWTDPDRAPGGWWNPGQWRVVCYDTRSHGQSLDGMLETLFHEASHQFMTMVTSGGGSAPSWLNEGTASFFEGTRAMADGRVLWPEAAGGRLWSLSGMLKSGEGPTLADVIAYDEPASYPFDHYPFGWGLIYFLQEYEDPETLQKIWRSAYAEIVAQASKGARSSLDLFASVVLADENPGGFENLAQFEAVWKRWILEEVTPLYAGRTREDHREELRRARLDRYLYAAENASKNKRAPVPENELLDRALGEVAALRALLAERTSKALAVAVNAAVGGKEKAPDATEEAELLLLEADVLQRRGRDQSAAAALENALDLASAGRFALVDERREELEKRMLRLDRGNAPVRQLRLRSERLRTRTERLLARYESEGDVWLLRARGLAELGAVLLDDAGLRRRSDELRLRAIAAGRVAPRRLRAGGEDWVSIFSGTEERFEHGLGSVSLSMPGRVAGRICTELPVIPEYTVRARLTRTGETYRSSYHGLVVAGSPTDVWYAVGISGGRDLVVKRVERGASGSTRLRNVLKRSLATDLRELAELPLSVVVRADSSLSITLGEDGGAPIEVSLPEPLPARACIGILVKDAELTLNALRVEFLP